MRHINAYKNAKLQKVYSHQSAMFLGEAKLAYQESLSYARGSFERKLYTDYYNSLLRKGIDSGMKSRGF